MTDIVTITPNPAIDLSTTVDRILPVVKLRGTSQRRDPGGGGVNVARVIERLGGDAGAIYPVGGSLGALLRRLVGRLRGHFRHQSRSDSCFALFVERRAARVIFCWLRPARFGECGRHDAQMAALWRDLAQHRHVAGVPG